VPTLERAGHTGPEDPGATRPRFSVVVPAYNEASTLGSCLDSLLSQDFRGSYEIIVVDNNSTDGTAGVARSRGVRVVHEPREGVCSARQRGTELAEGEIVVSTDADTVFSRGWLSRIDQAFREDPARVAVAGPCRFVDPPWWGRVYTWVLFHVVSVIARVTGRILYVTATNIAFRRSVWPGYNVEATQGGDELDLLRRLRARGRVAFDLGNPTFTSSRRLHRGLAYNIVVTCFYYYLLGYAVNRVTGRRVVGMAPAFRNGKGCQRTVRRRVRDVASVSVGVAFCLMFGDLALRLVEATW
jgi:glycosyltransferase involved in cell wall biosynthesis